MDDNPWNLYIQSVKKIKQNKVKKNLNHKETIFKPEDSFFVYASDINNYFSIGPEAKFSMAIQDIEKKIGSDAIPGYRKKRQRNRSIDLRLDLHGLTLDQAFLRLSEFLEFSYVNKKRQVLVITGKGKLDQPAIMKISVPRWLEHTQLKQYVESYEIAKYELGGEGAILINISCNNSAVR
jgi:DNA-nicking Smr family endonuclease